MLAVNKRVAGKYLGKFSFTGVIRTFRPIRAKTDGAFEVTVDLDSPIDVFGRPASALLVHTKFTGESTSYAIDSDELFTLFEI